MNLVRVNSLEEGIGVARDLIARGENRNAMGQLMALRVERNIYPQSSICGQLFVALNDVYCGDVVQPLAIVGRRGDVDYYAT